MKSKTKISTLEQEKTDQAQRISSYYKLHAKIYDASRWTFLFGRKTLLKLIPFSADAAIKIIEVGCGTGINLQTLAHQFPKAQIIGYDVSPNMINESKKKLDIFGDRVKLICAPYGADPHAESENADCILFSYCLTMVNPQYSELIERARTDLKQNGVIAVVDFYDSNSTLFKNWMAVNHVRMEQHLSPHLLRNFITEQSFTKKAYASLWRYFLFIGKKSR